jgi:hypothetical protein
MNFSKRYGKGGFQQEQCVENTFKISCIKLIYDAMTLEI